MSKNRPFPPPGGEGAESPLGEITDSTPCFEATTDDVRVVVQTFWLDDQSEPDEHRYVWAYRIRIENHGGEQIQLLRRSWRIVDGQGRIDRVEGDGVVGEQPLSTPTPVSNTCRARHLKRQPASWAARTT